MTTFSRMEVGFGRLNAPLARKESLASARKALQFIADGYENHDINHVDYRVKVYQVAIETLEEIT